MNANSSVPYSKKKLWGIWFWEYRPSKYHSQEILPFGGGGKFWLFWIKKYIKNCKKFDYIPGKFASFRRLHDVGGCTVKSTKRCFWPSPEYCTHWWQMNALCTTNLCLSYDLSSQKLKNHSHESWCRPKCIMIQTRNTELWSSPWKWALIFDSFSPILR